MAAVDLDGGGQHAEFGQGNPIPRPVQRVRDRRAVGDPVNGRFEVLARLPTRFTSGYFVAALAVKR